MLPAALPTTRVTPEEYLAFERASEASHEHVEWYTGLDERRWLFCDVEGLDAVVELDRPRCTIRLADVYARVADPLEPGLAEAR